MGSAVLSSDGIDMYIASDSPIKVTLPDTFSPGKQIIIFNMETITGKRIKEGNTRLIEFELPSVSWQKINIKTTK